MLSQSEIKELESFYLNNNLSPEIKKSFVYAKGFYDRYFFSDYFLQENGYIIEGLKQASPEYFEELWRYLDDGVDIDLIIPRGHAKTTGILIWILHAMCYNKERGILYIAKGILGKLGLGRIRGELETNSLLQLYFGNLVPRNSDDIKDKSLKKRQSTFLEFTNGCWIMTLSFGQSPRGLRPTKIIIDDAQDNKDVINRQVVDKFNQWIFSSLYNTLLDGGSMCIIGTVIGNLCLVVFVRDIKLWKTIQYEACDENFNNILRPQMWSKEKLIKRRDVIGSSLFNQDYRNIPLSRSDNLIKENWIKIYSELPDKFDYVIIGIDPAQKEKESSDYTGYCIIGKAGNNYYVLKSGQIKLSPMANEDFIYNLYELYKPQYNCRYFVRKEDNIEIGMGQHLKERGCALETVRATSDKYTRLLEQAPKIETGNVRFGINDKELIYQLTTFPDVEHDDIMDAFVWAIREKKKQGFYVGAV